MCGIAGIMRRDKAGEAIGATLDRFAEALAHRGPDGRGHYARGAVGLVQTRLAIVDVAGGDQPFFEPGGAALIANGEIYNDLALRRDLADVEFASGSDCETALHLYRRHGLAFADLLRGMYAIAIHDPAAGRLVLTRDPFGIKPLYYVETNVCFAFASEPQALLALGLVDRAVEPAARAELLQLQFTTGRDTIFPGIKRVLPGETLVIVEGRIIERRRRAALPSGGPVAIEDEAALEALDGILRGSVAAHCRSDVPYGAFLSGGIDSALVLSYVKEHAGGRPIAFTVGFDGAGVADERAAAARIAETVGAEHVAIGFDESDFWTLLPRVAAAMDDPAADYATLPTFKLAIEAAKSVKVVLTGEGGDELFAGYGRYRSLMRPWWLGGRQPRGRGAFDEVKGAAGVLAGWRDGVAATEATEAVGGRTRLQAAQAVDCADWLPNDLLTKLDRCLMAHGLEGRTPFLDPEVAQFAFKLPDRLKLRHGVGKHLPRLLAARRLPILEAGAAKKGFTVPVAGWIAARAATLAPLVARQAGVAALFDAGTVGAVFADRGKRGGFAAWTLLFYALWHRHHIEAAPIAASVFDALESR